MLWTFVGTYISIVSSFWKKYRLSCVLRAVFTTSYRGPDMSSREDLRNTVAPYDGSGDVSAWMKKVKLVAKIKKIRDLSEFIPLYLDGQAFDVYDEMPDGDKEDGTKIEATLRAAFEVRAYEVREVLVDRYTAYERLQKRRWIPGEPADVYLASLRRLAGLANVTDEEVIRGAFVVGLPEDISQQLRASKRASTCHMSALCAQARHLLQQKMERGQEMAAVAATSDRRARRTPPPAASRRTHSDPARGGRSCFICGANHLARVCPKRADRRQRDVICWKCGELNQATW